MATALSYACEACASYQNLVSSIIVYASHVLPYRYCTYGALVGHRLKTDERECR